MDVNSYAGDIISWANQQAFLLRARQFDQLDIEHLADEIEDVGKSEQRELAHRLAILLAHLLKWEYQPERRGTSWRRTIYEQRKRILRRVQKNPSLNYDLDNSEYWSEIWADALDIATRETGFLYEIFPETCPWNSNEIMNLDWFPDN